MPYDVQIRQVPQQTFAAVRGQANAQNIADRIMTLLSEVWEYLRSTDIRDTGHNVVVYWAEPGEKRFFTEDGIPIEAGVQVAAPFERTGRVGCSTVPGGRVATVAHVGPYEKLPEAHTAVREWCAEHGLVLAGPNWEMYGDWTDNPDALRTDVCYLLR